MTRKQSLFFTFDGEDSRKYGIMQIHSNSGMYTESIGSNKSIIEESIPGKDTRYYFGVERTPIEDTLEITFEDAYVTDEQIFEISEWLFHDDYRPLVFIDQPEKVYYAMFHGDVQLIHSGVNQGYLSLNYRCNSPFSYSPIYKEELYIDSDTVSEELVITNRGSFRIKPIVKFKKIGNGDLSILNKSDGGKETKVTSILDKEEIEIDFSNEILETNLSGKYLYNNFNNQFLNLVKGVNRLDVKGKGTFTIEYYYTFNT